MMRALLAAILFVVMICSQTAHSASGIASWYGPGFHGRRTASGETFNQHALTAAHMTLPFGTMLRVTNVRNGKSVVVRVNDRGDFARLGVAVDLSRGAFAAIASPASGRVAVRIERVR